MKSIYALLIGVVLLLAACTPQPPATPPAAPPVIEQPVTPPAPAVVPPTQTEPPKTTTVDNSGPYGSAFPDLPSDVRDILVNAQSKAQGGISYQYIKTVSANLATDIAVNSIVYERGTVRKLKLSHPQVAQYANRRDTTYDFAILNADTKTATAYCTDNTLCDGILPVERQADYENLDFMTPLDWLAGLRKTQKVGQEQIDRRNVYKLSAEVDGRSVFVWVDRFSGLPVQIQDDKTVYKFQNLALGVTDKDLAVPTSP